MPAVLVVVVVTVVSASELLAGSARIVDRRRERLRSGEFLGVRPRMEERLQRRVARLTIFRSVGMVATVALSLAFAAAMLEWWIDPAFTSLRNAFWWAIVTVSTTGYGDVVPTSTWGRVVASILMIAGVSAIPITTSIVVSILVARVQAEQWKRDEAGREEIVERLDRLEKALARLEPDR